MSDWIHSLPVGLMAVLVFGATYAVDALVYTIVLTLARGDRLRDFKGVSPGLLPPLGILFGLLVAFLAAQVWGDVDRANTAVNREASALRAVVLLSPGFPGEPGERCANWSGSRFTLPRRWSGRRWLTRRLRSA